MATGPVAEEPVSSIGLGDKSKELKFWINEIEKYERDFKPWETRSKKIIKRYKDERPANSKIVQFNILWSNVQTLQPALYAQAPKPNVDRRWLDEDDLARVVAQVVERSTSYFVETELFDDVMRQCVQDRLLPGRGTSWVRYCPYFETAQTEEKQISDNAEAGEPMGPDEAPEVEELSGEDVLIDYVYWQDFGHTFGRTWQEVRAVWRRVYLDRAELISRFGKELGSKIPLDWADEQEKKASPDITKAAVYEIWDKSRKKALWVSKSQTDVLDEVDDPLELDGFFPCPKPVYATLANDNLIPVPDYVQYQDQAHELDLLTNRIGKICEALRVSGVYDVSAEGVQKLLTEGSENRLIPVENWAVFGEKGGLKGVIDWFPLDVMATTLSELYQARDHTKQDLYEVTGISDIIRGATNANETATAQQIKGKFATLRLDAMQKDVARFGRDNVKLIAEIICSHFSLDTIKKISGVKLLTNQEKQMLQMQAAQAPQGAGVPPSQPAPTPMQQAPTASAAPPMDEQTAELLAMPSWEDVYAVLKDDIIRDYKIDIETDSTIKVDQDAEKQARMEMLNASGQFMGQIVPMLQAQPDLAPLAMQMLMFGVRGFKVARDLEGEFENAMKKVKKTIANPPPPKPTPEEIQAQVQQQQLQQTGQIKQAELQQKGQEGQTDAQIRAAELKLKEQELAQQAQIEQAKLQLAHRQQAHAELTTRLDAKTKADPSVAMSDPEMQGDGQTPPLMQMLMQQSQMQQENMHAMQMMMQAMNQGLQRVAEIQAAGDSALLSAMTATKKAVKDKNGNWQVIVGDRKH